MLARPGPQPALVVPLADAPAARAQDVVGRDCVEMEVGQRFRVPACGMSLGTWCDILWPVPSEVEAQNARKQRAAARQARMTVEVVALGERKPSPYADSSPDDRLAAAVRLIEHHQALRGVFSTVPRSAWPGETFVAGEAVG